MKENVAPSGVTVFSPLARSVMDRFAEGLVLFDPDGRVLYANRGGRDVLNDLAGENGLNSASLLQKLGRGGGRIERLAVGSVVLGHAVYLPGSAPADTLAEQERRAIVETLQSTGGKLTETARRLGISRTTLWRRLREYGVQPQSAEVPRER
ncbi:MAG TPA: helix-turn-helix domain-containing protein [Gemmatimonadales bacterium]